MVKGDQAYDRKATHRVCKRVIIIQKLCDGIADMILDAVLGSPGPCLVANKNLIWSTQNQLRHDPKSRN